jgi:DNA processing protein
MNAADADLCLGAASAWIGPVRLQRLLQRFGSADRILAAPAAQVAAVAQMSLSQAVSLRKFCAEFDVAAEIQALAQAGARSLRIGGEGYPKRLVALGQAPLMLHLRGTLPPEGAPCVAVVGTREPSDYGRRMARGLASGLAKAGVWVVSGLAAGIDGEAHTACLDAGGRTLAVMGTGLDHIYPVEHTDLAARIVAQGGGIVSQFSCTAGGHKKNFPMRNAVISGMSLGVVVVEGGSKSGALITAERALEQGLDVFAVPGEADAPMAQGPLDLLEQGARLVRTASDVLQELGLEPRRPRVRATALPAVALDAQPGLELEPGLEEGSDAEKLWQVLRSRPGLDLDAAAALSGLDAAATASALTQLELAGALRMAPGGRPELTGGD